MKKIKIELNLKNLKAAAFEELQEFYCPIAIYLNEINITENKQENTENLNDIPLYLISSLLLAIPELKEGYSHKYIFFDNPFCLDFNPEGNVVEVTPSWIEDLEKLNKQSYIYKKPTALSFKELAEEIIKTSKEFFRVIEKQLKSQDLKLLKDFEESINTGQKYIY